MIVCPWKDIKKYASLLPGIDEAFDAVNALTEYENKKNYPLSNGNRFFIAVETTKEPALAEAHRNYLDIQYIVKGKEVMGWAPLEACQEAGIPFIFCGYGLGQAESWDARIESIEELLEI